MPELQTSDDVLLLPRTTAITLMHTAQLSPDRSVAGIIALRDNVPAGLLPCAPESAPALEQACQQATQTGGVFAVYCSKPTAAAEPMDLPAAVLDIASRHPLLIVSLNTKGVWERRAWTHTDSGFIERELTAIEPPTAA